RLGPCRLLLYVAALLAGSVSTSVAQSATVIESARSDVEKEPLYAAIRDAYPAEFAELLRKFTDAYARGETTQESMDTVRPIVERVLARSLIVAPSDDLIEYLNVVLSYVEELNKIDAESCVGYLDKRRGARRNVDLAEKLPLLVERESVVVVKIIRE